MRTVLVLNRDQMGYGDAKLGLKILGTCLRKLVNFKGLEAVLLYNAGVRLATKVSPVAVELNHLHDHGVELLPCGTCVEYYGLKGEMLVDRLSNMDEIVLAMQSADKVITL